MTDVKTHVFFDQFFLCFWLLADEPEAFSEASLFVSFFDHFFVFLLAFRLLLEVCLWTALAARDVL